MDSEPLYLNPYENTYVEPDEEIIKMYKTHSKDDATAKVREQLGHLDSITLNIAITGMTGSGKSTFVNAIRGLGSDDLGAAPTGVVETTLTNNMYLHPTMPNVKIWDLPGIGSPKFQAKKYLKEVKLDTFDFFIILSADRFKENDIMLAKAIKKKKKLFYFVRTKIDNDIQTQRHRVQFKEQVMLISVREDCEKHLAQIGNPKVFLISSHNLDKYDFKDLIATLEEELPDNKRRALIQSLPLCSLEVLKKKKAHFKKMVWLSAFAAGAAGLVPLPGVPVGCDIAILIEFFNKVYQSFGLDDASLQRLADRINKPVGPLRSAKKSRFADGVTRDVVLQFFERPLMKAALGTITAFNFTLLCGSLPAGGLSVAMMYHLLNKGLLELEEDAKAVLQASELEHFEGLSETLLQMKMGH
ncbi:hypothetical protein ACEWY4_019769 [Coilia grayii]|uniref:IRG-type G domain-containing protein n=1 Tax=Coilia grayii TaxID=363190 RepID=A0ABD1JAN7_9TELE